MKKVLIALDYNPTAQKVAEVGFSMAKAMNAEITLLHVMSDPVYYSSTGYDPVMGYTGFAGITGPMQINTNDGLKKASQQFLEKSKHHLGDNTIQTLVEDGDSADSILRAAKNLNVDIIVMGSHSRKWLENILMGSVTEKVLHNTSIPLFIVPTKKHN
jgi:nucleotide-binding universal stress UspA family protein